MPDSALNAPTTARTYKVGSLTYTNWGLAKVIVWLVLGHVFLGLMQFPVTSLMLSLFKEGGRDPFAGITIVSQTIPQVLGYISGFLIGPIVGFQSDRHRGERGRRIPFLLWLVPFTGLSLILTACAPAMGNWIALNLNISKTGVMLGLTAVFMGGFYFLRGFVSSIFFYLVADVVPREYMGRFMVAFLVLSEASALLWNGCFFGWSLGHATAVSLTIGLISTAVFIAMCLRVKEGAYAPPPDQPYGGGLGGIARSYYHECFRSSFFLWFFVAMALTGLAGAGGQYNTLFYRNNLNLTPQEIGAISIWTMIPGLLLTIPAGYLCDRVHPLRVLLFSIPATAAIALVSFFCVHGRISLIICSVLASIPAAASIAHFPISVRLLPRNRFGQFSAAGGFVGSIVYLLGRAAAAGAGSFMGWVGSYRYLYLYSAIMSAVAFMALLHVYRAWQRHGGLKNYAPPQLSGCQVELGTS
jgi:MFS family permease